MITKLANRNVVVVADQFNPSIVTQMWLVKNGILAEDDFEEPSLFAPMVRDVQSREFNLLITPERLQLTPKILTESEKELVVSKVGTIIKTLPHTPYIAAGLNFTWHINPEAEKIADFTRALFYHDIPLYKEFDTGDARFGGYLSKDALGFRLKLDIKPLVLKSNQEQEETLQFTFNYHLDLSGESKVEKILDLLDRWDEAKELSSKLVKSVAEG